MYTFFPALLLAKSKARSVAALAVISPLARTARNTCSELGMADTVSILAAFGAAPGREYEGQKRRPPASDQGPFPRCALAIFLLAARWSCASMNHAASPQLPGLLPFSRLQRSCDFVMRDRPIPTIFAAHSPHFSLVSARSRSCRRFGGRTTRLCAVPRSQRFASAPAVGLYRLRRCQFDRSHKNQRCLSRR